MAIDTSNRLVQLPLRQAVSHLVQVGVFNHTTDHVVTLGPFRQIHRLATLAAKWEMGLLLVNGRSTNRTDIRVILIGFLGHRGDLLE